MKLIKKNNHFFKWVGSKRNIIHTLGHYIPNKFNNYYEPFLGSGYLFWSLFEIFQDEKKYFISDINELLIKTFSTIKNNPAEVIRLLKVCESSHCEEYYYKIRSYDRNTDSSYSNEELVARFIYLTRASFNGVWRTNNKGQNNMPYCKNGKRKILFEKEINEWSKILNNSNVHLKNDSFDNILQSVSAGDFVYLDPPYYETYDNSRFSEQDHINLKNMIDILNSKGVYFLLSHNKHPFYEDLYKDYKIEYLDCQRYISCKVEKRGVIKEMAIFNYERDED